MLLRFCKRLRLLCLVAKGALKRPNGNYLLAVPHPVRRAWPMVTSSVPTVSLARWALLSPSRGWGKWGSVRLPGPSRVWLGFTQMSDFTACLLHGCTTLLLGIRGVWGFFLFSDSLLYYKPCSNKWNGCKLEQLGRFHNGKCRELLLEICFCNRQPVVAGEVRNAHAAWTESLADTQKMFPNWICPWKFRGDLILYHKYGLHIQCKLLTDGY